MRQLPDAIESYLRELKAVLILTLGGCPLLQRAAAFPKKVPNSGLAIIGRFKSTHGLCLLL